MSVNECSTLGGVSLDQAASLVAAGVCAYEVVTTTTVSPLSAPSNFSSSGMVAAASCYNNVSFSQSMYLQSLLFGILWRADNSATGVADTHCGLVQYQSVTCSQHGVGYAVTFTWCGAWPQKWSTYAYTYVNYGSNFTVSVLANGVPISFDHGLREGYNPYNNTNYNFFSW